MELVCRLLEVSRSGYYEWLGRKPSLRRQKDQELKRRLLLHGGDDTALSRFNNAVGDGNVLFRADHRDGAAAFPMEAQQLFIVSENEQVAVREEEGAGELPLQQAQPAACA